MRSIPSAMILLLTSTLATCNSDDSGATLDNPDDSGATLDSSCNENADCTDSQVAEDMKLIRCPNEIYCLDGICLGECQDFCEVVRDDVNPCTEPRQCAIVFQSSVETKSLCTMLPIPCSEAADCPAYRTLLDDGTQGEWTCEDDVCQYPGLEYATH